MWEPWAEERARMERMRVEREREREAFPPEEGWKERMRAGRERAEEERMGAERTGPPEPAMVTSREAAAAGILSQMVEGESEDSEEEDREIGPYDTPNTLSITERVRIKWTLENTRRVATTREGDTFFDVCKVIGENVALTHDDWELF